jgi:hypothetical protein
MPDEDLDDFQLERTRRPEDTVRPYRPAIEGKKSGQLLPVTLAAVAVVAVGVLALLFLVFRHPAKPKVEATPPPPATVTPHAPPGAASAAALPALDESDAFVRQLAASLSTHPALARWLSQTALIRTLTAVVLNIADGETPRPHLELLAPKQRFHATGRARRIVPDPAGFAGYDAFGDAIASLDAAATARAYRTLEPLFEAAYRDLGHPEGGFAGALDRAIAALVAVPVLRNDVLLVPHAIGFRYADPKLEGLTGAQKQFLRLGPRNVRLVQGKLREVAAALGLSSASTR